MLRDQSTTYPVVYRQSNAGSSFSNVTDFLTHALVSEKMELELSDPVTPRSAAAFSHFPLIGWLLIENIRVVTQYSQEVVVPEFLIRLSRLELDDVELL